MLKALLELNPLEDSDEHVNEKYVGHQKEYRHQHRWNPAAWHAICP